jgi:hypothetical protein
MRTNASGQGGGALFGIPKPGRARFGTLLLPRDSREAGATSLSIFSFFLSKVRLGLDHCRSSDRGHDKAGVSGARPRSCGEEWKGLCRRALAFAPMNP